MSATSDVPNVAAEYAAALLATCGAANARLGSVHTLHADREWAESGAMALTGFAHGPPLLAPGPLASAAHGCIVALAATARALSLPNAAALEEIDGPALLGERAAIAGFSRNGTTSPGGSCHLLRCADGWIAVNLARSEDIELLPAWLENPDFAVANGCDPAERLSRVVRERAVDVLVERARLLGLPIAEAAASIDPPVAPFRAVLAGHRSESPRAKRPRVIDLSSLWAGPLAGDLLAFAGASVIKVESTRRPDGARRGPSEFNDLLNGRKASVALDLSSPDGLRALRALVAAADIVLESSRPRALRQLGIDAEQIVAETPGLVWVSITGYGRGELTVDRVAFGDDAGAAAGLAIPLAGRDGVPVFCGDAIADPLAGVHAAAAALAWWQRGESALLDVSLCDVAAYAASFPAPSRLGQVREVARERAVQSRTGLEWEVIVDGERSLVLPPRARSVVCTARALGADTERVLAELDTQPC